MSFRIGSSPWFEFVAGELGPSLLGIEVYKGGSSLGRIPRKGEDKNRFYIGFLVNLPPSDELQALLGYEKYYLRDLESEVYELTFSIPSFPLLRAMLKAAETHQLSPRKDKEFSDLFFGLYKKGGYTFLFE